MNREWGFWSEVKLDALERYLKRFTTASRSAQTVLYLDLFAGSILNVRRDQPNRTFEGSTVRALRTEPAFTHLRFFELESKAESLGNHLDQQFPGDERYRVIPGDCNASIAQSLSELRSEGLDWSPTFAFIDPDAFELSWTTLSSLASFKNSQARTKAEMLILLSHTSIPRLAGWDSAMGLDETLSLSTTTFYGTSVWRQIFNRRIQYGLSANDARGLYTDLFRHRLQYVLGYRQTLSIEMRNERGSPVYVLVFATDHDAGVRIMSSVFEQAREQSAEYRAEIADRRKRQQLDERGEIPLLDMTDPALQPQPIYFESTQTDDEPVLPDWLMSALDQE
ncbi:three-Cys-motif partner protein TcmP [Candidatus Poriferisocius sp.]|uniref:three-Cys-motif partner protein TcmP n=1 Tax=Candidatus Poriferisocius sp. TaxID=3101276 RepID=UPI003B01282A